MCVKWRTRLPWCSMTVASDATLGGQLGQGLQLCMLRGLSSATAEFRGWSRVLTPLPSFSQEDVPETSQKSFGDVKGCPEAKVS